jgi:hypothetical protein
MLIIVTLVAFVVALFAWAAAKFTKATKPVRRQVIGNINRKFFRRHISRVYLAPLLFERMLHLMGFTRAPLGAVQFCNTGEGTHGDGIKSYLPDAATTLRYLFYEQGVTTKDYCKLALGVNEPLGHSDDLADANALDLAIAIKLLGCVKGTQRAVSDGTVTNNTRICVATDGTGRATCPAGGAGTFWIVGKAIVPTDNDAGGPVAAGDTFEFVPCFPVSKAY